MPLSIGGTTYDFKAENAKIGANDTVADAYNVGSRFFETMGIPLIRGRDFPVQEGSERVAIINEIIAQRMFPGADPLGRRVSQYNKV